MIGGGPNPAKVRVGTAVTSCRLAIATGAFVGLAIFAAGTGETAAQGLTGNLGVHDPSSVIKLDGTYYLYYTRNRLGRKISTDRVNWQDNNQWRVFPQGGLPDWHQELVPANTGSLWAPDVAYFNNLYHLYYSVSSFGSQDSAIGLVTNPTLDPDDPAYEWTDQGPVIESNSGASYNTIDPAIVQTSQGKVYMTFGSFWNGIYIVGLDPETGHRLPGSPGNPRGLAGRGAIPTDAIEAPYIYERGDYYYLFVNWDACCRREDSTYNIRVGRSESVIGPYVDRDGQRLSAGGGTLFLGTEGNFIGPGHASIFTDEGVDWFGYHYYDGNDNGNSKYNLRTIYWDAEGWPVIGAAAPIPGDYNNDGTVTAADYVAYRNLAGSEALLPNRTPDLEGPIGQGDYEFWLANFGRSFTDSGAAAAIPEPATGSLIALLALASLAVRRRSR